MRTLFLNPPSFAGFDGGGARYRAKREVRSSWYPSWLAQPAAMARKLFPRMKGLLAEVFTQPGMVARRLREGGGFVRSLSRRAREAS